jgi:hypothetical protein
MRHASNLRCEKEIRKQKTKDKISQIEIPFTQSWQRVLRENLRKEER